MKTILKIPFDACIVDKEKRGAAKAPEIIQKLTEDKIKGAEWKEIGITSDFEETQNNITKAALESYEKGQVIGIGGDHSVSYGLMRAFAKRFDGGLIFFDAHLDCEDDLLPPSHEDIIKAIVNEGFFDPKNILMMGSRKFYPKELEFIKKKDIRLGKLDDIKNFIKDKENLYISIDIDVFDPEFAPGTSYPEKNGLEPSDVLSMLKIIAKSGKVKGLDIAEVNPEKDIGNKTGKLAAKLLIGFLDAVSEKDI